MSGRRILICASTVGHLLRFHLPYLEALAREGNAVFTAAAGEADGLPEGVRHMDAPFTKRFVSLNNLRVTLRLAGLMRRERFDVVCVHTSLAAFFARLAVLLAGKRGARVVNTVHGYLFSEKGRGLRRSVLLLAERLTAPATDDLLVMNAEDARIARKYRLYRGRLVRIDGMGLPAERFSPASEDEKKAARRALGLPEGAFVMLYAAEFSRRKNQRFLLESLPALPDDAYLLLPGGGQYLDRCRALARQLGIDGRVLLPGPVPDTRAYLRAADACVSSSVSEGLPFHVMEAMASGLPSILSRVKGHTDLVEDGRGGLLYPPGDGGAFCRAAERLRSDAALRSRMGGAALRDAARYDLRSVLPSVLPYYR